MSAELARLADSRTRVVGVKQTVKAVRRREVAVVYMAEDADSQVLHDLRQLCAAESIPIVTVATMQELGRAAGIQVGSATVGLLKS